MRRAIFCETATLCLRDDKSALSPGNLNGEGSLRIGEDGCEPAGVDDPLGRLGHLCELPSEFKALATVDPVGGTERDDRTSLIGVVSGVASIAASGGEAPAAAPIELGVWGIEVGALASASGGGEFECC